MLYSALMICATIAGAASLNMSFPMGAVPRLLLGCAKGYHLLELIKIIMKNITAKTLLG